MGGTPLDQDVTGRWVVQNNYIELHFMQTQASVKAPAGRYEAIYLLGLDRKSGQYQLHLFDTFGPKFAKTIGLGSRRGNTIEFVFSYPDGKFSNTFTWQPESGTWKMLLGETDARGHWHEFAVKFMRRS